MEMNDNTQWLIRTSNNRISGPFPLKDLKSKILALEISFQDEVCPSEGYWFALHERAEVEKWIGIEVPKPKKLSSGTDVTQGGWTDDEPTATDTDLKAPPKPTTRVAPPPAVPPISTASVMPSGSVMVTPVAARPQVQVEKKESDRMKKIRWFIKEFGFFVVIALSLLVFAGVRLARLN